jgi:acetyl esterase
MTLHPQAAAFLELVAAANLPDMIAAGPTVARKYSHDQSGISGEIDPSVDIRIEFFTSSTADVAVAIYTPASTSQEKRAGLVYYHGGGWVLNYITKYHAQLAAMAKKTNSVIVSVNYQKAP